MTPIATSPDTSLPQNSHSGYSLEFLEDSYRATEEIGRAAVLSLQTAGTFTKYAKTLLGSAQNIASWTEEASPAGGTTVVTPQALLESATKARNAAEAIIRTSKQHLRSIAKQGFLLAQARWSACVQSSAAREQLAEWMREWERRLAVQERLGAKDPLDQSEDIGGAITSEEEWPESPRDAVYNSTLNPSAG